MNVQPVSFMPKQDAKAPSSMNAQENRVDEKAFSKELERRGDTLGAKKLPEKQLKPQGSKPAEKSEVASKEDTSVEKKVAKVDSEKKSESGEGKLTKKQTTKEERLKKFMDSLESEFQVPPTRIVEAFSELTPEELSLPADQSIDRVVEKLDLNGEEMAKVKDLYGDLVQDLGELDARKAESDIGTAQNMAALGLTRERFDKVKNDRVALQKSLDQMNQSFWQPQLTPQIATPIQADVMAKAQMAARGKSGLDSYRDFSQDSMAAGLVSGDLAIDQNREFLYDPRSGEVVNPDPNLMLNEEGDQVFSDKEAAAMGAATALALSKMKAKDVDTKALAGLDSGFNMEPSKAALPGGLKPNQLANMESLASGPTDVSTAMLAKLANSSNSSGGSSDFFSKGEGNSGSQKSQVSGKKTDGEEMKSMLAASLGTGAEIKDSSLNQAPIAAPLTKAEISPEVADRNIQNVMQQAQYLVKNGGGEMKVKMTPEGLGEIELIVQLKEGRVQLHMATENKETKKMLESSISDLKESLSQQKISLDSVKIDSVVRTNVENQTNSQTQSGPNQNQNQENRDTRQFWNQFQENFGGRSQRDALLEQPKAKGYAPKKSATLAPATDASTASRSNGKSSSLNLVA